MARALAGEVQRDVGLLTPAQIAWKPSRQEWSIGESFDRLVTSNRTYCPAFEQIVCWKQRATIWERLPVLPGL